MRETVLVTEPEYHKAEETFSAETRLNVEPAPSDEAALAEAVRRRGARAVIVGVTAYTGRLYEALGDVADAAAADGATGGANRAILARFGVGYDSIDLAAAARHGIVVTNTPGALDQSVAEHTLWLIGAVARTIPAADARMRSGAFANPAGFEVAGKTLGVIGFGRIGRRVARAAHFGLQMRVIVGDCLPADHLATREGRPVADVCREFGVDEYTTDVDRVFATSDIVTLHLPAIPETRHFASADRLRRMQPHACLINTARGLVLDESALFDALQTGRLAAAALDVYETEPYEPVEVAKDLCALENVVLTPHTGSNTRESNRRMAEATVADAAAFFAGSFDRLNRVN